MGGILGLCTGFSIITAVEFFYWFTVRIVGDHYRKKNKISPESLEDKDSSEDEEQTGKCHQCTKLESKIKEVKCQMEATKQELKTTKQQMEATKQEMKLTKEELKQQKETSKHQMEATKQELRKQKETSNQQIEAAKKEMESVVKQQMVQFENLLMSNLQNRK